MLYFIAKTVQSFNQKQSKYFLFFCISVQVLIACQSSKFSKLHFGPWVRNSSELLRRCSRSRWHVPIGPRPHGSLYKAGHCTSQKRNPQITRHITNRIFHSLSDSVGSNCNKLRNWRTTKKNPKFSEPKFEWIQGSFHWFSEIQSWIIIIESSFLQFKHRIRRWKQESVRSQRKEVEKKRERISESRTSEEEEDYRFIFGFKARNQQTEPDSKSSWNFSSKSPNKTQVTIKNSPLHTCQSQRSWINANPWDFEQVWFKTVKP